MSEMIMLGIDGVHELKEVNDGSFTGPLVHTFSHFPAKQEC